MNADIELYVCVECGNVSPVPNDICSNCGGKMVPQDKINMPAEKSEDEDDGAANENGFLSLDALEQRERRENDQTSDTDENE